MKGIHLHNTEVRREEEAKRINEKQVKRQDGRGTLCLRVSPNSKLSLKKSGNAPAKILCRLKLLHLRVKSELHISKREFPLVACGREQKTMVKKRERAEQKASDRTRSLTARGTVMKASS